MTPRERELLDAVADAPDDDGPRLEWADHVGGRRGELVVIQCDLARGGWSRDEYIARRRREHEILNNHFGELLVPMYSRNEVEFRRGFVEAIRAGFDVGSHITTMLESAPTLHSLAVRGLYGLYELLQWKSLGPIDRIGVVRPRAIVQDERDRFLERPRGDEALAMLAESPHLEGLTGIAVGDGSVTERGVQALVASRRIEQLETAWLDEGNVATSAMIALVDSCPNLWSLSASCTMEFPALAQRLPPLEELELVHVNDRALDELAQSLAGRSLTTLRVSQGMIASGAALAGLRQLQALELTHAAVSFEEIVRVPLRHLRRLVIACAIPTDDAFEIVEAFGGQLHELAIDASDELCKELAQYAPGVVKLERRRRFP